MKDFVRRLELFAGMWMSSMGIMFVYKLFTDDKFDFSIVIFISLIFYIASLSFDNYFIELLKLKNKE